LQIDVAVGSHGAKTLVDADQLDCGLRHAACPTFIFYRLVKTPSMTPRPCQLAGAAFTLDKSPPACQFRTWPRPSQRYRIGLKIGLDFQQHDAKIVRLGAYFRRPIGRMSL
ncbi:hypothetical protein, partial [Mesorhizobium sp.]|uniref:hypothetical protein n=1 Tax=Mesorhizobium sp. TaxID=1871066 RepID=UPI00257D3096